MYSANQSFVGTKGENVISKNPDLAPLFQKIYIATQQPSVQTDLLARFRKNDHTESG